METTAPSVPSWLNLDQIVPPELSAEIDALTPEAERLAAQVTDLSKRVRDVLRKYEAAQAGCGVTAIDDFPQYIDALSGYTVLEAALTIIDGAAEAARGGSASGSHYSSCARAAGLEVIVWAEDES